MDIETTLLNNNSNNNRETNYYQLDNLSRLDKITLGKLSFIINFHQFIHYPSCLVITAADSSTYLNFFFDANSPSAVTTKKTFPIFTNATTTGIQVQQNFQASLYAKMPDISMTD